MQRRRRFGFASLCRPSQRATDSFVGWREDGDYTSIGCWGWGSKGGSGSGYEQLSVSLSQLPEGLLDFVHLQATRCLLLARAPRVLRGGGNTHLDR